MRVRREVLPPLTPHGQEADAMQALANARYGRIGVTVAVLAGLLAVAVGGGYSASRSLLANGAAYAVDGVGIDRLNAATGAPDAEILDLAKGPNRIRVVHRDGQVYLVDTVLASVTRLDPGTLKAGAVVGGPGAGDGGAVDVVTGGGTTAIVDLGKGVLQRVDQVTLDAIGRPIKVPGGVTGAVADSKGVLWVASASSGAVLRLDKAGKRTPVPVAPSGESLVVTLVGDAPVVVDLGEGRITGIDPATLRRSRTATLPKAPTGEVKLSGADTPLPNLWALDVDAHNLFRVDLAKGAVDGPVTIGAGQVTWGAPVVQAGRVYVPNLGDHRMVVVDAKSLNRLDELTVPGDGPDFDVTLEGGALWANDPTHGKALVVDREGEVKEVGKGEGLGRKGPVPVPSPDTQDVTPPAPGGPVQPLLDLTGRPPETTPVVPPPVTAAIPAPPAPPADSVVPDLKGLDRGAACAALVAVKLTCQAGDGPGGGVGKVSRQDPAAGRTLPPGGTVNVTMGTGVEVPVITGSNRDEACKALLEATLVCVPQAVTLERGKTRNQVFEQEPAAKQRVDEASTVVARYWGDPRLLDVPDVTAKTPKEACSVLATAGFTCTETTGPGRPLGRVLSQAPATGLKADEGSDVTVTVAVTTTMPNLLDKSSLTVCTTLTRDLGLPAANCSKAPVDAEENPKDTVKVTTPAPGEEVTLSTIVRFVRRTGLVPVRRVVGLTTAEACRAMTDDGLTCTQDSGGEGPPGSVGRIAAQQPVEGTLLAPGKPVTVTFYSSQQVRVPTVGGADIDAACNAVAAAGLNCNAVPDSSGNYRRVSGQSPAGDAAASPGSVVTVSYEPSVRKQIWRLRRGNTGTEADTWMVTASAPGEGYHTFLIGQGFGTEGPICNAYADGEGVPGRASLVDWMNTTRPPYPHHTFTTGGPPPGIWDTKNNARTAVVAAGDSGPAKIYVLTRGYSHFFTQDYDLGVRLRANGNFLSGPDQVFTCW